MINQVVLVGRLTKDPELRYTADGAAVVNITLAVTRNFRNAEGGIDTDFVQLHALAESSREYGELLPERFHYRRHGTDSNAKL
ncbi:single-stranded DNA-binding protein [Parageobacillus thermoglucosidasius NBRC 107763]|nr:single-stranded DNA-binding protein [Parageobacillus thermoglucosidasius NBRC 107763]